MSQLTDWSNFYVIVGSSAGALLGLQFVVLTLIAQRPFHALLPPAAYATLAVSAFVAVSRPRPALFLVGAATLVFLFVGIHNAWDAVTWHVFNKTKEESQRDG